MKGDRPYHCHPQMRDQGLRCSDRPEHRNPGSADVSCDMVFLSGIHEDTSILQMRR